MNVIWVKLTRELPNLFYGKKTLLSILSREKDTSVKPQKKKSLMSVKRQFCQSKRQFCQPFFNLLVKKEKKTLLSQNLKSLNPPKMHSTSHSRKQWTLKYMFRYSWHLCSIIDEPSYLSQIFSGVQSIFILNWISWIPTLFW